MSMNNSGDTIGNSTRDLRDCSAVLQPTAQQRSPFVEGRVGEHVYKNRCAGLLNPYSAWIFTGQLILDISVSLQRHC